MGEDQEFLGQLEAPGLLHEAEGEGRAQLHAPEPAEAPPQGLGMEDQGDVRAAALASRQEARLHLEGVRLEQHLQAPDPAGGEVLEAQPDASPHPGEEVALLHGDQVQAPDGLAADPARHQEEAQHDGEQHVEEVVAGVHGEPAHEQQGEEELEPQAGAGEPEPSVVP